MKKTALITAFLTVMALLTGSSMAAADDGEMTNEVTTGAQFYEVYGDQGRFREDRFKRDAFGGGLDSLHFDSKNFEIDLRALINDEYRYHTKLKKADVGYVLIKGQFARRYFDGSNEYWDPAAYGLSGTERIKDNRPGSTGDIDDGFYETHHFVERPDENLYAERLDMTLELGLTKPERPEMLFGWHRWERRGRELLLRGERTYLNTGASWLQPRQRSLAALATIGGVSDLFYMDVSKTVDEKHQLRLRQEFESYRDKQYIEFPRYKWAKATTANAVLDQYRTFEDAPKFQNLTSLVSADAELGENTLLTSGYMFNHLKNESQRQVVRPNVANPYHTRYTLTENNRNTHAGTLGLRLNKLAGVKDLDFIAGARSEKSDTNSETNLLDSGLKPRRSRTDYDEWGFAEDAELRFRGIPGTLTSLRAALEQRNVDQVQLADITKHETFDPTLFNSGIPWVDYEAKIKERNQAYAFKVVNRTLPVKLTAGFKYQLKNRKYNIIRDIDPRFYPGRMAGIETVRKEASFGVNKLLPKRGSVALKYQFRDERINTAAARGRTQDWKINRVTASLGAAPTDKLFVLGSLTHERYRLDTPTEITTPASDWAPGTAAYDYAADYTTALLNTSYAFTRALAGTVDYQFTTTVGPNNYAYHKGGAGLSYKTKGGDTVRLGGEYYDFADNAQRGLDNYKGYAVKTSYTYAF